MISILTIIVVIVFGISYFYLYKMGQRTKDQLMEGMTNGLTSNAAAFADEIKAKSVKLHDTLLISKYHDDYENAILNMDEYISYSMLNELMTMTDPKDVTKLGAMYQSKAALNQLAKFVDKGGTDPL